jgi:hypothetical protein
MPFVIPTYYASQFAKNATLFQRKEFFKKSYKCQFIFMGLFSGYNLTMDNTAKSNLPIRKSIFQ